MSFAFPFVNSHKSDIRHLMYAMYDDHSDNDQGTAKHSLRDGMHAWLFEMIMILV